MFGIFHRLLLCLPPEIAHHLGILGLKILQFVTFKVFQLNGAPSASQSPAILLPSAPTLKVLNRLGLAAGFDKNAEVYAALSTIGFGFVETGTVTVLPQEGNPKPRLWRVGQDGLINQMGFNNCGLEVFKKHLELYRKNVGIPVLANIGKGKNTPNEEAIKDYERLLKGLVSVADGFVINLSSPNTPNLRELQSTQFIDSLQPILGEKPTFIKLAPDLDDQSMRVLLTAIGEHSRLSGVILTNTSKSLALSLYQRNEGGYSGAALLERSLACVSMARDILGAKKTVIGVGGVSSVSDAKKMRAAGADLVEIYTSFIYQGPPLVKELSRELQ